LTAIQAGIAGPIKLHFQLLGLKPVLSGRTK